VTPGVKVAASAVAADQRFGLYDATGFRLAGEAAASPSRQAQWYFARETIAVPAPGQAVAGFATNVRAADDARSWAATADPGAPPALPPLVWVGAPEVAVHARLDATAGSLRLADGARVPFAPAPRHPLNRSYFDASSAAFFAQREVKLRGATVGGRFIGRTLWPEDFRLDAEAPRHPLPAGLPAAEALRALIRAEPHGGAGSPFATSILWQRDPAAHAAAIAPGRIAIGLLLNGAQGDDDEAHGGHFALVTGRTRDDGAIGDWLVNNFYTLDWESEKGIIAAPVPLDNYLADLNSGQAWYRPSCMLVLTLCGARAAALLQGALNRVYNQFYRHQLVYQHATMNCAGISVDVLRALGFPVPARDPASPWLGGVALPWFLTTTRSLDKARTAVDYLLEDQTRLMPAAAFEDTAALALQLVDGARAQAAAVPDGGRLARMIAEDTETIAWLRIPQLPSSRASGDAPVVTPAEYRSRMPRHPQVVPVPPRPFPPALRDPDLLHAPWRPSDRVAIGWAAIVAALVAWLAARWW
jgi:hypothetical protein